MKIDVRVLTQVAEYLGNYVYLLIDPRTMAPFYVGKGTGTRLAAHGLEAETLSASDDETPVERSRKIAVIHDIRSAGLEPEVWILRHGMGSEYTHVEAAAIDLLSSFLTQSSPRMTPLSHLAALTNERRESARGHGIETLSNIVAEFGAPDLQPNIPQILLITLKPWVELEEVSPGGTVRSGYGFRTEWLNSTDRAAYANELGDSVRCWWKLSQSRVEEHGIDHVVAVHRGVTRGLFRIIPDSWEHDAGSGRRGFMVDPVLEGPLFDQVIGKYGYRTPPKKRGDISTLNYWPRPV
ncbi:hypothetical protein [Arthrobacter oryzae]|uniref:hypothetical protein n=1 Tax=Arthrobacter oryzae TaxID=409290 RepID=UPI002784AE45|nr:hypothetical protein [Arthrobacter oryzae]MDQ0076802.1 hypothetical protein [Arthrobacter oryzae]